MGDVLGIRRGTLSVRYFGAPLIISRKLDVADYRMLIDKIIARTKSWTTRFMFFASRLQLISLCSYYLKVLLRRLKVFLVHSFGKDFPEMHLEPR